MPWKCILNSRSGGNPQRLLRSFAELRRSGEISVLIDLFSSTPEMNVSEIFNGGKVLICGGDGTFSTLLPWAIRGQAQIGLWPSGTANDLAREFGFSRLSQKYSLESALEILDHSPVQPLDIWSLSWSSGKHLFSNYLSFGFDAACVADFAAWRQKVSRSFSGKLLNRLLYVAAALKELSSPKIGPLKVRSPANLEVELNAQRSLFLANISSVMGLGYSSQKCDPSDQELELMALPGLKAFLMALWAKGGLEQGASFFGQAKDWEIQVPEGIAIQADGEALAPITETCFKIGLAAKVMMFKPKFS